VAIRLSEDALFGASWNAPPLTSDFSLTGSPTIPYAVLIAQKGISQRSAKSNLKRSADMAAYDGVNINLVNVGDGSTVLFRGLQACGINLQGCPFQIHEFTGGAGISGGAWTDTIIETGIVDDLTWSATGLKLKCKNSRLRRNAPMFTVINNGQYDTVADLIADINANNVTCNFPYANDEEDGKVVPMSFGSLQYAKMIRTADMVLPFVVNGSILDSITNSYITLFSDPTVPCSSDNPWYRYRIPNGAITNDLQVFPIITIADRGDWTLPSSSDSDTMYFPIHANGSGISNNNNPDRRKAGDYWTIAAAGTLNGQAVARGDRITANNNAPTNNWTSTGWTYTPAADNNPPSLNYVTGVNNPATFRIRFAHPTTNGTWESSTDGTTWTTVSVSNYSSIHLTALEKNYINVLQSTTSKNDQRLIYSCYPYRDIPTSYEAAFDSTLLNPDDSFIIITVYSVFGNALVGWADLENGRIIPGGTTVETEADQSWVELDAIKRQYNADIWPCVGFTDTEG
jgi:hypothetical protein